MLVSSEKFGSTKWSYLQNLSYGILLFLGYYSKKGGEGVSFISFAKKFIIVKGSKKVSCIARGSVVSVLKFFIFQDISWEKVERIIYSSFFLFTKLLYGRLLRRSLLRERVKKGFLYTRIRCMIKVLEYYLKGKENVLFFLKIFMRKKFIVRKDGKFELFIL